MTAVGGVIEASKDGTRLEVRPLFPTSVPNPTIIHEINEVEEVFSMVESATTTKIENCFDVYEVGAGAGGDTLEFEAGVPDDYSVDHPQANLNTTLVGVLHVQVRSCPEYTVRHLTPEVVSLKPLGKRRKVLTETIMFSKGSATTAKPVYAVRNVVGFGIDPANISFSTGYAGVEIISDLPKYAYGAAKITYETEFDDYYVRYTGNAVEWVDTFLLEHADGTNI